MDIEELCKNRNETTLMNFNTDIELVAATAARYGLERVVVAMINKGAMDYHWIAREAAYGGHKEFVYKLIKRDKKFTRVNDVFACAAAEGGQIEILKE